MLKGFCSQDALPGRAVKRLKLNLCPGRRVHPACGRSRGTANTDKQLRNTGWKVEVEMCWIEIPDAAVRNEVRDRLIVDPDAIGPKSSSQPGTTLLLAFSAGAILGILSGLLWF